MLYKGAAVAGGIGTVGGVTGVAVLANKDSAKFEQVKKQVEDKTKTDLESFIKSFGINKEEEKGIIEAIKDKTKDFLKDGKADISKIVSAIEGLGESKTKNKETEIANKLKTAAKDKIKDKIKDKTKEDIEKIEFKQLEEFKDYIEEIKDKGDKKNNVCRVVQRELFLKLAESDFDFGIKKPTGTEENFLDLIKACLTSKN